jgi:dTDP-4-dehydrorhamnose 3,5-epimerase
VKVTPTRLPDVLLIEPRVLGDARGYFLETFRAEQYAEAGIPGPFVQDNVSFSQRGVLRGLHLQHPRSQGKLVSVLRGEVFDVAVDVRVGSPTFGQWTGEYLSGETKRQLYIPPGFAHGFVVTADDALFVYKCTEYYDSTSEHSVRWNDPRIGIEWPVANPSLSAKDSVAPHLDELPPNSLPAFVSDLARASEQSDR